MKKIYVIIVVLLSLSIGQECDLGFTVISGECYFDSDIDVLEAFIYNSEGSINLILDDNGNGVIEPLELCSQTWAEGRITEFDCHPIIINGNYNYIETWNKSVHLSLHNSGFLEWPHV